MACVVARVSRLRFVDLMGEGDVVELALSLWAHLPRVAPMSILDRTMARFAPYDLDFAFEADQLHPPHPFAELIRLAFAPELNPEAQVLSSARSNLGSERPELVSEAVHEQWHRTIIHFADRYGLWLPYDLGKYENGNST